MLQSDTIAFLAELKLNNNKPWFDQNRKRYEAAKIDFETFTTEVIKATSTFDGSIAHLTAKQCNFRINRDVRFSKNKDPYKTNLALHITAAGKGVNQAGYYFHAEPSGPFLAGGIWMPAAPELKKIRQEIDYNFSEFEKIVTEPSFKTAFTQLDRSELLSRPPKGYEAENPAIAYLKLKNFIASTTIGSQELQANHLVKRIAENFKTLMPLINFLNKALEG